MKDEPTLADVLADLTRAKCAFQLRGLIAAVGIDPDAMLAEREEAIATATAKEG